jgi:hypothetical protein
VGAEVINSPLNHSVLFVKGKDLIFTSDYGKIIVGFDIIVSLRPNNVFMYYEMIQAAMLADLHSLKLLMIVPLKTMNVQFTLYRVAVFPVRLFNNSFVQFEVEKDYFRTDVLQRHYLTLTEVELVKCRGKDFYICPVDYAIYSTESNSCALSLFQSTNPPRDMWTQSDFASTPTTFREARNNGAVLSARENDGVLPVSTEPDQ